jgi:thymidylate synthase (FAD)
MSESTSCTEPPIVRDIFSTSEISSWSNLPLYGDVGFVRLVDKMGSDLTVVNAARVSYAKQKAEFAASDEKLLRYLATHGHMSPFRHCFVQFHIKAPEFVARQAYKHVVGIETSGGSSGGGGIAKDHAWNEISGRYVEMQCEFWRPETWRGTPAQGQSKQGSSGPVEFQSIAHQWYEHSVIESYNTYKQLLELGVCREQARTVLPLSVMTEWYWSMSLEAAVHFCKLRTAPDAQAEIRELAVAMLSVIESLYPYSIAALMAV